jgi:hypothetical protein
MCILTNTNSSMKIILSERQKKLLEQNPAMPNGPIGCADCGHTFVPEDDEVTCPNCQHANNPTLITEAASLEQILEHLKKTGWGQSPFTYELAIKGLDYKVDGEVKEITIEPLNQIVSVEMSKLVVYYGDENFYGGLEWVKSSGNGTSTKKAIAHYFEPLITYYGVTSINVFSDDYTLTYDEKWGWNMVNHPQKSITP